MSDKVTLSPRQRRAIAALMSAKDIRAASKQAKVSERQMYRWLDDPVFQNEVKAVEAQAIDHAVRRLSELSGLAIDTLKAAMRDKESVIGAKVRAADIVLSRLLNLKELADLEARIASLEQAQAMRDKQA